MKTTRLALLFLCFPLLTSAQELQSANSGEALARFAEGGDNIPAAAIALLPEGFFSQNLVRAVADGGNYSAVIDLAELLESTAPSKQKDLQGLTLRLDNRSAHPNDVVLSALTRDGRKAENFLVRVEGQSSKQLDIAQLRRAGGLYLLSLQSFSARLEVATSQGTSTVDAAILEPVTAPVRAAAKTDDVENFSGRSALGGGKACRNQISFCSDCEETIQLCTGGSCAVATANRSFWYTSSSGHTYYKVNVHYPVNGPVFHCHLSSYASRFTPQCKSTSQSTFQPATAGNCGLPGSANATHLWSNLDDTLFFGVTSSVSCTSGCALTWTVDRL